ncbi:CLC_0170 family protein [Paenibacillus prosopidis]|uniref:Uncharacterized protein n=1 Tax=Paenibacillus prosopidis TaxID=630520 RepID=A0A368W571_9BACL|nr:CLC_0170 family protein [Paenibacillus prosopidis]RCW49414.1 hypothetical protein DFP97_10472 [Paenibacillus prosopidis]
MLGGGYSISYLNYGIFLWLFSGLFILVFDAKGHHSAARNKEQKVSRFLGWFNLTAGVVVFLVKWLFL